MFCKNCGAELGDGSVFCNKCGANQQVQEVGQQYGTQPVMVVKAKVPGRGLGISSMVLGIIGLVYAVAAIVSANAAKEMVEYYGERYPASDTTAFLVFMILPILSLCFAPSAIKQGYKNGVSYSGLIMGIIGLIGYLIAFAIAP